MDIAQRIRDTERNFENQKALLLDQDTIIKNAETTSIEIRTEMAKLQGEHRVLNDLLEEKQSSKANKKAAVVEAVPEEK